MVLIVSFKNDIFSCEASIYNIHHSKQFNNTFWISFLFLNHVFYILGWAWTSGFSPLQFKFWEWNALPYPVYFVVRIKFKAGFMLGKPSTNN